MNECVIYDFETLGQDQKNSVVVSFAMIAFSEKRYLYEPYTYEELVDSCKYIKFDVEDQVTNFGRKINKETVDWWNSQGEEAKKQIRPSKEDRSILEFYEFVINNCECPKIKKSYTRGNTFDPMFLQYLMSDTGHQDPFHWRTVRDTRSMIDGMSFGMDLDNGFTPGDLTSKFVKHDPRHDVAMDVMRMQLLAQAILGK
jgi:hypothetical protein